MQKLQRAASSGDVRRKQPPKKGGLPIDKNGMMKPFEAKIKALKAFQQQEEEEVASPPPELTEPDDVIDRSPELTEPDDVIDKAFFHRMQNEIIYSIENSQVELTRFMSELCENFTQVATEMKKDVLVQNKTEISQLQADLRSEMQNNVLAITAEVQKSRVQGPSSLSLQPVLDRIDQLSAKFDSGLTVECNPSTLMPAAAAAGAAASTAVLNKMDEVQAKVLEALESKKLKSPEQHSSGDETSVPAMVVSSSDDLTALLEQINVQFTILSGSLKPDSFCKPVLQEIAALGSLMETNHTKLSSTIQVLENTKVREEDFLPLMNRIDSLGTKLTSTLQVLENAKVREEESLPVMIRNEAVASNDALDLSAGFAPVLQEIRALRVSLEKSKIQEEDRITAVDSKIEMSFGKFEAVQTEIVALLKATEKVKISEEDLLPVISRIDALKLDASFLNPVIQTIEAVQADMMMQTSAEVKTLSDQVKSLSDQVSSDPVRHSMHSPEGLGDLGPVLKKLDIVIDPAFFAPVLDKIDTLDKRLVARVISMWTTDEERKWTTVAPSRSKRESAPNVMSPTQSKHVAFTAQTDSRADAAAAAAAAAAPAAPAAGAAKAAVQQQQQQQQQLQKQQLEQEEKQERFNPNFKVQLKLEELASLQKHSGLHEFHKH